MAIALMSMCAVSLHANKEASLGVRLHAQKEADLFEDRVVSDVVSALAPDCVAERSADKKINMDKKLSVRPKTFDGGTGQIWARALSRYLKFRKAYLKDPSFVNLLAQGQEPQIMVVACSDSRVDPGLILQTYLGDLFVVRNVANIIPVFTKDTCYHGAGAALEYGVKALRVNHLIILGHSQCGGVRGALEGVGIPNDFITKWVSQIKKTKKGVFDAEIDDFLSTLTGDGGEISVHEHLCGYEQTRDMFTQDYASDKDSESSVCFRRKGKRAGTANNRISDAVVNLYAKQALNISYNNSMTYPFIKDKVDRGELVVHRWYFDIEKGTVYIYSPDKKIYEPLNEKALNEFLVSQGVVIA